MEAAGLIENKVGRKDSAQIAQPESVVGDTSSPWASMTPDQRRRTRLEQEIATGMTNNGGVMAKLRPSAIEKRKQELAAMPPKEAAGAAPSSGVIPAVPAAPIRLGRNNTPLNEGGKPFKTRKAAGDAKKLQPMMRVVTVPGGYALADKTPAQLAAEAKAAKRLATPRTSARGEPIPAHAFVAAAGGLNPVAASDLGVDGNPRIGNRRLFSGQGRGLSMDQATQMLVADGYLGEGATVNDAFALIKRSLTQPQYNADGIERIAEAESTAQFEDYLAAQEEVAQDDEFDPFGPAPVSLDGFSDDMLESSGYDAAADAIKAEVRALLEMANAQGVDTESIMLDAHEQTRNATEQDYYEAAKSALEAAIAGSNRDRGTPAGSEGQGPGAAAANAAEQGVNQPVALDQQEQAATENVAPAVSTTVDMPPTRQQESSPFAPFATGRYRISIRDEGNGPYAQVVAIQRGSGVEIEMRMPGEALEHPAFSQLNARAQALFKTPTANMFDAEPAALELAAQTPAEAAARQEQAEQAEKSQAATKRAADAAAKAEDERKRIAQASVRAADRFELGQDPMDSLTGQGSVFDAQEPEQQAPTAQPITRADVDAAQQQAATAITERIDAMSAQDAQKIAARFLPTMGVNVPAGKARIKTAMTDPKVNLQAAADEVGVVLADDVKRALQADGEGRVEEGDATESEAPKADTVPLSSVIDKMNAKNGRGLTDADRVPEQKPVSKTPTIDRHNATMAAVREGKATAEQFRASFEQVVDGKAAIVAELDTMTKVLLLREGGPFVQMRYANEKKADVVDAVYREMVGEYALGESVTYGMGRDSYQNAVRKLVEATDADKLAQYVKDRQDEIAEAQARGKARAAALENPKTRDDFRNLLDAHMRTGKTRKESFLMLTPDQRIQYDTLEAESTREARETRKRAQKSEVRAAGQTTAGEIVATKHTRDGYDLFVVKLADRLSKEDYSTVLASAKKLGGWYSAFRGNGAIPGFQFKEKANAEAFLALAGGDTAAAQEQVAQRRDAFEDDRSQTAVERLRAMADKLEEGAAEVEGQQRKTNTERRARFASAALQAAAADKAKAQTMRNIAQAIEDGKAKFLDEVRAKSQVDMLTGIVDTAKGAELRAKYPSYADQEKRKGEPPTAETADFADFPSYGAFRSDLATLGRQMLEVDGTKKLGQRLMSVADDVTDAYLEFAKANFQDVSRFGRGDSLADFASKDEAERAIKRSGLTGKAIVLPIKRGQNRVILSPSEAIGRGLWQGDGDKRITLTAEFGAELVEAIGRRGNKQNQLSVPWQFQTAYDRRKALARIGIETPSEFRAALREFINLKEQAVANRTRELELQMVGRKADGLDFFPTSAEVADQMIEAADLTPDMAVLEPSAGMGHLADRIREAGAEPDVIEISVDRRALLEEKGYTTQAVDDFLDLKPREFYTFGDTFRAPDGAEGIMRGANGNRVRLVNQAGDMVGAGYYDRADLTGVAHNGTASGYDRIIMNPPFSNRRDAEHVRHAYNLLKPGGRIVAIMGEGVFFGQDKKAQDFREWLESVDGTSEKLPEGSFMDPSLPVNTSVNARMVVIDKPAGAPAFSRASAGLSPEEAVAMFNATRPATADQRTAPTDSNERNVATQLLVDGLKAKWTRAPEIIVARNMQDTQIPQAVRDYDQTLKSQGASGEPRGFIYKGKVYLLSDELKGPQQIAEVLFHEVLGHYGLRGAFGDALTPILKQIAALRRADVLAKAKEYGFDLSKEQDRLSAAEEVLAEMAQTTPELGYVKRAISAIRNWLRANVPGFKGLALTDADIIQAYLLPARGFVTRSKETPKQSIDRAMLAFSRVWHGSPHKFLQFDSSKIGTGEGAQAYGHGLYLAESQDVAKWYADKLTEGAHVTYKGKKVGGVQANLDDPFSYATNQISTSIMAGKDAASAKRDYIKGWEAEIERASKFFAENPNPQYHAARQATLAKQKQLISTASTLSEDLFKVVKPESSLYQVDLPDDQIAKMLDWDKPLSSQSKEVQSAFGSVVGRDLSVDTGWAKLSGEEALRAAVEIAGYKGGGEKLLSQAGIPGIRYLDSSSRGNGAGTSNYVIFPGMEKILTILDVNGEPVTGAEKAKVLGEQMDMAFSRGTNAGMATNNVVGNTQGGRSADDTTPGAAKRIIDAGIEFVSQIESLAEKHGRVYIRWSPSASGDLSGKKASRDFVSGETHSGLSAIEITGDMHPVDIASRLSEYGFLRLQDRRSTPHVFLAEKVGVDSDGYESIKPTMLLLDSDADVVNAIDSKLADIMDAMDNIERESERLKKSPGHPAVVERLNAAKAKLLRLLPNESTAPDSGGAAFSRTAGDQTQTEAAFSRGTNESMTNNDVVGNQGGRSADDTALGKFAMAGDMVDGLLVRDEIPNQGSIGSSIDDYTVLRGIREIPLTAFTQLPKLKYYSISEEARTKRLAEQIKASGEINPLIVVIDKEGPYVLEGGHRFDALREIGKTSFPALVVLDNESLNEPTAPDSADIRFSRTTDAAKAVGDTLKSITVANVKKRAGFKLKDYLGLGLQALGRRQIVDIYGDLLPLADYNRLVTQMEADKNEGGAEADQLVTRWAKLDDEAKLADLMHDATLAQIDPDKPYADGDDKGKFLMLERKFKLLSDEAKAVYRDTRDAYKAHHAKVRSAIKERIERSEIKGERKAALLKQMDDEFFVAVKGVYFPLARFGQYVVTVKGPDGQVESVSRAETMAEADALRGNLLSAFPRDKGFTVGRVMLSKEFVASRDAVGRGFMTELYQVLDKQDMDAAQRAELEDTLGQLYLSSLPDLSWAKHGIHRKGTPGFSQDARRAYAQNMFHGSRYLAKLRYSDLMQDELTAMQKHVDDWREVEDFDQNSAQRVVDEMNKRHESLMNPKSNALSTALTSFGFVFHLGLSPASAMVNLSQTALVAYPIMGAKWGFGKASAALLKASAEAAKGKNDITGSLNADERAAYDEAVRAGTIDVTMAHDLAGIAQGEDAGVMWKIRPAMRLASSLFHHAERFNRQVTFVAAYRLAREAGADHHAAFEQATKATYDGHFDYGAANRPRFMQGNVAKVLLLFKQYGQNMVYTLARNAQQSIKGESPEVRAQARKALGGLLAMHAAAAGVLGLPMVTTLLAAASMIGGDDDEPWDAKVALQNMLADTFGQKPAEVLAHGLSRLTPWDISGRVGLDRLIFPDVQEGLEGQRLWESAATQALGPVGGIFGGALKGLDLMSDGHYKLGLEAMLPAVLRQAVKSFRYGMDGAQDKGGVVIKDEVSMPAVVGQLLGFSPSEVRLAQEGKSAVYQQDRALGERRQELLTKAARATMAKDAEARAEAMKEIERFNQKNPTRRITPLNVLQSVRNRNKRIDQSEGGIYLPKNRRDAMDAGRFAVSE